MILNRYAYGIPMRQSHPRLCPVIVRRRSSDNIQGRIVEAADSVVEAARVIFHD